MTNYFDNVVFLTRNTSLTLTELDNWSWFEFEMYIIHLKQALDKEQEENKRQQMQEAKQSASIRSQMQAYMQAHK